MSCDTFHRREGVVTNISFEFTALLEAQSWLIVVTTGTERFLNMRLNLSIATVALRAAIELMNTHAVS